MDAEFFRKLLDKLAEKELMEEPPVGAQGPDPIGAHIAPNTPPEVADHLRAMDQAGRGEINKSYYDTQSPEAKAAMLRQVNQAPQNPNAQTADQRAAGLQAKIDQGKITSAQTAKNTGSGEYFQAPKAATPPPATTAQPKPAPATTPPPATTAQPKPVTAAPTAPQAASGSALDLTQPAYAYKGDNLKAGMSLGGTGVDPKLYAQLDAGNGNFNYRYDPKAQSHQVGYTANINPNLSATGAINQNQQGGRSVGAGLNYQVNPNTSISGSLEKDMTGNSGYKASVGLNSKF
jgi:hypothetical protein